MKKIFLIALAAFTVMPAGAKDKDKKKEAERTALSSPQLLHIL